MHPTLRYSTPLHSRALGLPWLLTILSLRLPPAHGLLRFEVADDSPASSDATQGGVGLRVLGFSIGPRMPDKSPSLHRVLRPEIPRESERERPATRLFLVGGKPCKLGFRGLGVGRFGVFLVLGGGGYLRRALVGAMSVG